MHKRIEFKIYSCYALTYRKVCKDIADRLYKNIDFNDVVISIEDISNNNTLTIRQQRSLSKYVSRTIRVYEDGVLTHIIAMSNTCFDLDKKQEFDNGISAKGNNTYGSKQYHGNSYLKQGTPAIFNFYYNEKALSPNVDLMFYLLDTEESYPHNLFNVMSYREIETIGFKILNLDAVDFEKYNQVCNSSITAKNIKFTSLSKFIRDIAYISKKNTGNNPSFLQCIEQEIISEDGEHSYLIDKYIYTFKSLSAQAYDSLFRCWCLNILAQQENKEIEFRLGKQYFAYREKEKKVSAKLPKTVLKTLENASITLNYVSDETFMLEIKSADKTYLKHKENDKLRNQTLFRNNLRKKGIPIECALCSEDNIEILEAAHFWEVKQIKKSSAKEINDFIKSNNLFSIIDSHSEYKNETFFKKYSLVNSGENGVWLCKNHHGLFDKNYYCFDGENGKIILHFSDKEDRKDFLATINGNEEFILPSEILTKATKAFISKRQCYF